MREYNLMKTGKGHPVCVLKISKQEHIMGLTQRMRLMPDPLFVAIRQMLKDKSIAPETSYITVIFEEGPSREYYGVVVCEKSVNVFTFRHESDGSYELLSWEDCKAGTRTYKRWEEDINIAIELLESQSAKSDE